MIVFNSNTALIIVALITSVFGYMSVVRQTKQVHREIKNPNGTTTGNAIEEIRLEQLRVKRELRKHGNALRRHIEEVASLDAWVRVKMQEEGSCDNA